MRSKAKAILLFFLFACIMQQIEGQEIVTDRKLTIEFENLSLEEALKQIETQTKIAFVYNSNLFSRTKKYSFSVEDMRIKNLLNKLLSPQNLGFKLVSDKIVIYKLRNAKKVTISGYVSDESTGEKLIAANIFDTQSYTGTISNTYGFFSLSLPEGQHEIGFSFVGYELQRMNLNLLNDTVININLLGIVTLSEVTVVAHDPSQVNVMSSRMSQIDLPVEKLRKLPSFLGEVDIIKSLQLLPGVQSGSEGSSGLYVRGGGPDQNLILLDGVPVYNVNHLFGFFSVFNASAIKNVTLSKGSFDARYGGRLSSVLDVRMKEGNEKEYHGDVSIGLISTSINFEGPIKKDKTAFNISARRTYIDFIARPIIKKLSEGETLGYFFYDVNAKINHKFSEKDRLFFSVYTGTDKGSVKQEYDFDGNKSTTDMTLFWSNIISALRWNHIYSNKLFSNTTLTYSKYQFSVLNQYDVKYPSGRSSSYSYDYRSGIEDLTAKIDFDYFPSPSHTVKFGGNYTNHTYKPGVTATILKAQSETVLDTIAGSSLIRSDEYYIYAEDNFDLGSRIKANFGVHYSGFSVQGELFQSIQPRLSMRFLATPKLSFKAAYSKMNQYIYLLSSSTISLPTDLWLPITKQTKPQRANQFAFGAFYSIKKGLDFSLETYYKRSYNLIEYKEGASFNDSNEWENKIEIGGKGWSYGIELLFQKTTGKTSGWIGYTYARADRQFDNLNFGRKFRARYDRRNDVGIAVTHKFNERIDIGATWVYGTGNAVTFSTYIYQPRLIPFQEEDFQMNFIKYLPYYEGRNNYRMPSYHRLDFGINFTKEKKNGVRTWSVGVYNVYSRRNPFFIYIKDNDIGTSKEIKQTSLFPIIPSLSYRYKF